MYIFPKDSVEKDFIKKVTFIHDILFGIKQNCIEIFRVIVYTRGEIDYFLNHEYSEMKRNNILYR